MQRLSHHQIVLAGATIPIVLVGLLRVVGIG
jgi:hypothetical protein